MGGRHAGPAYAIDDETAIKVADGTVEVVSEGHWKLFTPLIPHPNSEHRHHNFSIVRCNSCKRRCRVEMRDGQ